MRGRGRRQLRGDGELEDEMGEATNAGKWCSYCSTKDGHTDGCIKGPVVTKVTVLKLGLNGLGPWMMFPVNEDLSGLLTTIQELAPDVEANDDELTIKYARMTQKEIDDAGEFPGW